MAKLTLVMGNKNHSSWSIRPWLALKHTGAPFEEEVIALDQPNTAAKILARSPSGRVPALIDGDVVVWDSLAICETIAERFPEAKLWPADRADRAIARSVSAEMHSGFAALRENMPVNIRARLPGKGRTPEVLADIARIQSIWRAARSRPASSSGPFLFGHFTVADAMFAPVVTRFTTYGVELDEVSRAYSDAIWAHPAMKELAEAAKAEALTIPKYEI
jgi:glutathione S-transferase